MMGSNGNKCHALMLHNSKMTLVLHFELDLLKVLEKSL